MARKVSLLRTLLFTLGTGGALAFGAGSAFARPASACADPGAIGTCLNWYDLQEDVSAVRLLGDRGALRERMLLLRTELKPSVRRNAGGRGENSLPAPSWLLRAKISRDQQSTAAPLGSQWQVGSPQVR